MIALSNDTVQKRADGRMASPQIKPKGAQQ